MNKCFLLVLLVQLMVSNIHSQALVKMSGTVTNEASVPLARATVHLLNTQQTVLTNDAGSYTIPNIPPGQYTIEISLVGYATIGQSVNLDTSNQSFDFKIKAATRELETVIVTADKRETVLQKLPATVTAISSRQVQEYRLWNAKDISGMVPGLYSGNSGDERNVTSIRGITTTSYDPAVATYIDGVNQFSLDTYIPQLSDIERIEILRGPQGTLYGRNAMGGVINIITKQPTNSTNGFVELNIGDHNMQRYNAAIRTPLVKNKLFFGASGLFYKRDGYYNNVFNNTSFDKQQQLSGNYYLKYLPAAKWAITLNLKHQDNQNNGAYPMVNGVEEAFADPFQLNQDAIGKMMDNTLNTALSISHSGPGINFTSQTAFQNNHRYYKTPIDGDFSPLDAVTIANNYGNKWNNVKVFTQEFRLNSAAGKSSLFNWTAGAYFFHQYNPVKQATHFGKDAGLLGVPDTDFSSINITTGKNTGIALYGQGSYMITKKLALIAGIRYDFEDKNLSVRGEYQKDGEDALVTTPDTAASVNFSAVSPMFGLQYQIGDNSNLYASYSRGYRTGGLTQLSSDPSQPPLYPYNPEYSNNVEAGIKNYFFNKRLRLNAAVFFTYVNDAQVPTLVLPDAITVTRNSGELNSKGVELELSAKPFKGFQLDYSFGYTDATYKSLKLSSNGQSIDLDGKKQIFTPGTTSMLALQYSYAVGHKKQLELVARGEWFYLGKQYFDLANNISQSPYHMFNTRVGVSSKHLDLFFWMRNIGDKKYIEYAYDFGAVHLGTPQTYGITIRTMF